MKKFLSGLGMGMVAGACVGLAMAGMPNESQKRRIRRQAAKAMQSVEDAAASLGITHR